MALPAYSTAKTAVANFAHALLTQQHGSSARYLSISQYVDECQDGTNGTASIWSDVTVEDALDMATGNYCRTDPLRRKNHPWRHRRYKRRKSDRKNVRWGCPCGCSARKRAGFSGHGYTPRRSCSVRWSCPRRPGVRRQTMYKPLNLTLGALCSRHIDKRWFSGNSGPWDNSTAS